MRHHSPLLTSIWDDEDFCSLPALAQRVYFQVLSQKRLSMCGVIPYQPRNLARGACDTSADDITSWVEVLERANYLVVDRDTEELLARTVVKHDPPRGSKSIAGMWNAWREIDSATIRAAVVAELSTDVWHHETVEPPAEAKALRNAPSDGAFQSPKPDDSQPKNGGVQKTDSTVLLPSTTGHRPSSSVQAAATAPEANVVPLVRPDDDDDVTATIKAIAAARCAGRSMQNPRAYRAAVIDEVRQECADVIRVRLAAGETPDEIARSIDAPSPAMTRNPAPWCDSTCPTCDGDAWIETETGLAPCPDRKQLERSTR